MYKPGQVYQEEDDLSGGGGGKKDEKPVAPGAEEVKLLGQAVSFLAQGFEEVKKQGQSLAEGQAKLTALLETFQGTKEEKKAVVKDIFEGVDLESMTDADKLKLAISRTEEIVEARVAEALKANDKKISDLSDQFQQKNTKETIEKLAADNSDFFEWAPEIKALLGEQPNLTVKQAYVLVKNDNPKKVAEMTKKYAKPVSDTKKGFGLLPTSTRGDKGGKMTAQEAAEKAFDEVLGDIQNLVHNG